MKWQMLPLFSPLLWSDELVPLNCSIWSASNATDTKVKGLETGNCWLKFQAIMCRSLPISSVLVNSVSPYSLTVEHALGYICNQMTSYQFFLHHKICLSIRWIMKSLWYFQIKHWWFYNSIIRTSLTTGIHYSYKQGVFLQKLQDGQRNIPVTSDC